MKTDSKWLDIPGYEHIYQVSSCGKIRSLDRMVPHSRTKCGFVKIKGRELSGYTEVGRYPVVVLCTNNKKKTFYIHRLVAESFVSKTPGKNEVNHIDCNKENNNFSNLEWVTSSENTIHGLSRGIMNTSHGEAHHNSKLREKDVLAIFELAKNGHSNVDISKKYNISSTTVSFIKTKKSWKHLWK